MTRFDGVIEAVRYKGGRIDVVRLYERRGPTFSDRILMDRPTLVSRLKQGKHFVTGQRREFMASTFDVGTPVILGGQSGDQVVTTPEPPTGERLDGVPIF